MNHDRRYVITGLSTINPAGYDLESYWQTLIRGQPVFDSCQLFEDGTTTQIVGRVHDQNIQHKLSKRQVKRFDRFSVFSLAATQQALDHAKLDITPESQNHIGILMGNCTGGWTYVEPQMYPLYQGDFDAIDAYVATAWFPTAPQGEISILLGLGGFSKTIGAENISAGFALQQATYAIAEGKISVALVGGVEAPLTPLVYNACVRSGLISPKQVYQPFYPHADGSVLGEGVSMLVVEDYDHATMRNAKIYAEVVGIATGADLYDSMQQCLASSTTTAQDIDYVILDAHGTAEQDSEEYRAMTDLFGSDAQPYMSAPKSAYGNLLGASMATDLVTACLALEHQVIPPTSGQASKMLPVPVGTHVTQTSHATTIQHVLVNGRDNYGQGLSVLLKRH